MDWLMRSIILFLLMLVVALPVSAQNTKTQMNTEINTNFPNNATGLITPQILRTTTQDMVKSWVDWTVCSPGGVNGIPFWNNTSLAYVCGQASGNTTKVATVFATPTNGHCITFDGNGNLVDGGAPCVSSASGVNAGTVNQMAYYLASGSVISGLATGNSGVLVTSVGGTPSIATTLPSGLTIPTVTAPNATLNTATLASASMTSPTITAGALSATAGPILLGSASTPTLPASNGQAALFGSNIGGASLEGQGSIYDSRLLNSGGATAIGVLHGTTDTRALGNVFMGGASPWVDVRSGSNGCAIAKGDNSTDDYGAIQCQINYMQNNSLGSQNGGIIFFPCGAYKIFTPLAVSQGITLYGGGVQCSSIFTNGDIQGIKFYNSGTQQHWGGIYGLNIQGYQNTAATANLVEVDNFVNLTLENCQIVGGKFALDFEGAVGANGGLDNSVINCVVNGWGATGGAILENNSGNWFIDVKADTSGNTTATAIKILTDNSAAGNVIESHFVRVDASGTYQNALFITDTGAAHTIAAFTHFIMGQTSSIATTQNGWVSFTGSEMTTVTLGNNTQGAVVSSIGGNTTTTMSGGMRACAANFKFSC